MKWFALVTIETRGVKRVYRRRVHIGHNLLGPCHYAWGISSSHAPLRNLQFYLLPDSSTSIVFRTRAIVSVVYSIVFSANPVKPYERCVAPLRNLKTEVLLHTTPEELKIKTHQSPAILDLFLRKTRSGKSPYYRDDIFFEKRRFQNVFKTFSSSRKRKAAFSNSSGLKIVFEMPRFHDGVACNGRNQGAFSTFSGVSWTSYEISFFVLEIQSGSTLVSIQSCRSHERFSKN